MREKIFFFLFRPFRDVVVVFFFVATDATQGT
jgi:hypothetical protein